MGFKSRSGKKLTDKDVKYIKDIYRDLLEGYLNKMLEPDVGTLDMEHENPAVQAYQGLCKDFFVKFEENSKSDEDVVVEDFYNNSLLNLYSSFVDWADSPEKRKDAYYKQFFKNLGEHFKARYSGDDIVSKDSGLEVSMEPFKLTNKPMPGIEDIPDYDPSLPFEDPFIAARQANSGTYRDLFVSENQQQAEKASEEFKMVADFAKNSAAELQKKESIGFGDLYEIFSGLNTKLRPDEADRGKIRIEDIGAGSIEGINSAAIPADLFITLNKVADYMNQIKQVQDPKLRKSQAVQLAAFAYQMTISEHVFGNGNGRSCRFLSDTILQTFGLPPQVPTYALIGTGATIGKPLDFEKGAKCFLRGLLVESDLIKLKNNEIINGIDKKARSYLEVEHINTRILKTETVKQPDNTEETVYKHITPSNAINLAVQSGESKYSLASSLNDFIKADHFGTWNSDQYKKLIQTAKKTMMILESEPLYSAKSMKAIEKMETAIKGYEDHCNRHQKNNKTRNARLHAIADMKNALANVKDVGYMVSTVESAALKDELKEINAGLASHFSKEVFDNIEKESNSPDGISSDIREAIGKYILNDLLIKEIEKQGDNLNLDEVRSYTEDEKQISHILEGNTIELAIAEAKADPSYAEKTEQERMSTIADCFRAIKTKDLAAAKAEVLDNPDAKVEKEVRAEDTKTEERSIFNYM